jgi:ParB/RepB/Spo0J family partition protein
MTTTTAPNPTSGTLSVPIESIDVGPNVRELDSDHVDRLARSIELRGLISPLTVRPAGDGYALVAGWHRHAACQKAGLTEVDIVLRDREATTGDTAAENIVRKDLTPLGEANAIAAMLEEGYTPQGAAEVLGWSPQLVAARAKILELSEDAQRLLDRGELPVSAVDVLLAIGTVSPALAEATVAAVGEDVISGRQLANEPAWALRGVLQGGDGKLFAAYLAELHSRDIEQLRLGKKTAALLDEAEELYRKLDRYAYGLPRITFSELEVDQARAAGVLLEFDRGTPIITDRPLYRELAKQAIARTTEELRAAVAKRSEEGAERRRQGKRDRTPREQIEADHRATMRELVGRAHNVNLDLGAALRRDLAEVDPESMDVARFFAYSVLGPETTMLGGPNSRTVAETIAATGIRLVFGDYRETTTPILKSGKPGKTKVTYDDPEEATKWLWHFVDGAKTAAELYGRVLTVFACQHYAEQLVLSRSRRSSSVLPSSHDGRARKAFERVTRGVLPGSHKELQRALKRAARDQNKAIEDLAAAERKAKEAEPEGDDQAEAEVAGVEEDD